MPSTGDLIELKNNIEEFCVEIRKFRKNYEEEIREHIGESQEDNKNI